MTDGRVHCGGNCGPAAASVIVTWPPETSMADIEEAIKAAAREAVRRAREARQERQ